MKINGLPLRLTGAYRFLLPRADGDSLPLLLTPLSLGFHQRLRERGIQPPPIPLKIARDATGKPVRDAQGNAVTLADAGQPDYAAAVERHHQRVAVLAIVESLAQDPSLEFATPAPPAAHANGWTEYADNVFAELEAAGFTAGDLVLLCREICRISNLLDDQLTAARSNFSPARADDSS